MKAHILQHVAFEGPGSIASWLRQRDAAVSTTAFFESSAQLPETHDLDLLVVMGGPMSVNDEAALPWLVDEKRFVRAMLQAGKPVVGICLGAQLIANALGARVYPGPRREIGWLDIEGAAVDAPLLSLPPRERVFHWHGETFDLPSGATRLASSAGCRNQAFQWGERAIGLQFHLESTPQTVNAIVEHCRDELVPDMYVQSESVILAEPAASYARINALMGRVLDYVTR